MQKKSSKKNASIKLTIRNSDRKFREFAPSFSGNRQNFSVIEHIEDILSHEPITARHHDESLDFVMERLWNIQNELQDISVNVNQISRIIQTDSNLLNKEDYLLMLENLLQEVLKKQDELHRLVHPAFGEW